MSNENKLKHLDLIQAVITRMANNSFLLKGWAITLLAALFALFASNGAQLQYTLVGIVPILGFYALDSYFLYQEKLYRKLYDAVRVRAEEDIDFSLNAVVYKSKETYSDAFLSSPQVGIYAILLVLTLLVSGIGCYQQYNQLLKKDVVTSTNCSVKPK